jgi:PAS domain S-box-containing protein
MKVARRLWLGFLPIPVLTLVIGVVYLSVDRSLFFEPAWLLPLTNTLFITVICFLVTGIAVRNYRVTGRVQILLLGCGVLAFGTAAVLAAFLRDVPVLGANLNVTIYNSGALLAAIFHTVAAVLLMMGASAEIGFRKRRRLILLGYGGTVLLVGLLTFASLSGLTAPFFIQGSGPTPLRQAILGSADILFAFCFVIFMITFARNGEVFLFWYSSALALTSISLMAFFIQKSVGSAIGWSGRFSQYMGGLYFLIAILTAMRSARARHISLNSVLRSSLSPAEEKFRALADNAPDIIRRFDRGVRHIYVNLAGLRFYGKNAGAVIGRTIEQVGLSGEHARLWRERIERVFQTGEAMGVEDHVSTIEGARCYQTRCVPEYGVQGTVENVLVVSSDQTEHERAIEGLLASEDRYRTLAEFFPECIIVHKSGKILYVNPAGVAALRAGSAAAAVGRSLHDLILPENRERSRVRIRQVEEEGVAVAPLECGYLRFDGSRFHGESRAAPITWEGQRSTLLVVRDITERKRMEEALQAAHGELERRVEERTAALRQSNRLLRLLSESNQALVTLDNEQELIRAICQIMHEQGGYRMAWVGYAEQDEERSVRPIAHAGFEDGYLDLLKISWADTERGRGPTGTAIREGRVCQVSDFDTTTPAAPWRKEALRRGYRSSVALPLFADGRPFGALSVYAEEPSAFDAGQVMLLQELAGDMAYGIMALRGRLQRDAMRRNLEEKTVQLRTLASKILLAEEGERRRIARVLHDQLQQLIAGARYALESLKGAVEDAAYQEALGRVDAMLGESLKVSRSLTTELSPPIRHGGQLGPVLEWCAIFMKQKHGLTVSVHSDRETSLKSEELIVLLYQAVRELLFNVVKHAKVSSAFVSISEKDQGIVLVVQDEGAGFDPRLLVQNPGISGEYGIFSIRERLSLHGGRLEIESAPGRGSRFTLWVPLASEPDTRKTDPAAPSENAQLVREAFEAARASAVGTRKIRVLLADDHPVVRRGIALALKEQPDMDVVGEAQDGRQALELIARMLPDVVIMDMKMPGMSGIEATRVIHDRHPRIRVIAFSALDEPDQAKAMREAGAAGYLSKNDPPGRLLAKIRACAEG